MLNLNWENAAYGKFYLKDVSEAMTLCMHTVDKA